MEDRKIAKKILKSTCDFSIKYFSKLKAQYSKSTRHEQVCLFCLIKHTCLCYDKVIILSALNQQAKIFLRILRTQLRRAHQVYYKR